MLRQLRRTALRATATSLTLGLTLELTTHLPSEGRSSAFYHTLSDRVALPLIRGLGLDPEAAHNLAIWVVREGWAPTHREGRDDRDGWRVRMDSTPFGGAGGKGKGDDDSSSSRPKLVFPNPVGLAAGFDKDGVAVGGLLDVGFG